MSRCTRHCSLSGKLWYIVVVPTSIDLRIRHSCRGRRCCKTGKSGLDDPRAGARCCIHFALCITGYNQSSASFLDLTYEQAAAQSEVSNADSVNSFVPINVSWLSISSWISGRHVNGDYLLVAIQRSVYSGITQWDVVSVSRVCADDDVSSC